MDASSIAGRPLVAAIAAGVLAIVFLWAAIAKWAHPLATADSFESLGLEPRLSRIVPIVEIVTAALLVVLTVIGGLLAFALLAGFTVFLVDVVRQGVTTPCRCFGVSSSRPVGWISVARNVALMALALVAALYP